MPITPDFRAAFDDTQEKIDRVQGLALALDQLLSYHEAMEKPDPTNRAIFALSETLVDTASGLWPLHEAEWHAVRHGHAKATPVMELYQRWEETKSQPVTSKEQAESGASALEDMHKLMLATRSTCAADFVAKVAVLSIFGECGLPREFDCPDLWAEARAFIR